MENVEQEMTRSEEDILTWKSTGLQTSSAALFRSAANKVFIANMTANDRWKHGTRRRWRIYVLTEDNTPVVEPKFYTSKRGETSIFDLKGVSQSIMNRNNVIDRTISSLITRYDKL